MKYLREYIVVGLLGLTLGVVAGVHGGLYLGEPTAIYERKLEGDSRQFLSVEQLRNSPILKPFVKTNDGSYRPLSDVSSEETKGLVKNLQSKDKEK